MYINNTSLESLRIIHNIKYSQYNPTENIIFLYFLCLKSNRNMIIKGTGKFNFNLHFTL